MNELGDIAPVLTKAGVAKAFDILLATPEDRHSELLDLNHAPSVKNLPPAFVVTAEYDPLRDEAEYYAARLHKNGVPVSAQLLLLHLAMEQRQATADAIVLQHSCCCGLFQQIAQVLLTRACCLRDWYCTCNCDACTWTLGHSC